jgi:hypothetical protein
MKLHSIPVQIVAGAALALLSCGIHNSHAASAPLTQNAGGGPDQPPQLQRIQTWDEYRYVKLEQAYELLEHANADYQGHRVEAMHAIQKASEVLGIPLHGEAHAEESQMKSDHRLKKARHLLEDLASESGGKEQPHIQRAIKELDTALALK